MAAILAQGFLLGLAMAPFCAVACSAVFLPVILTREGSRLRSNAVAFGQFLVGRLVACVVVGLLAGRLGQILVGPALRWTATAACAALGVALLLYAASETAPESLPCRTVRAWGRTGRFPLLLGLLAGVNICPPFLAAITQVLRLGGMLNGLAFFLAFFTATSLVLLPTVFIAFGNLLPMVRSLGRVACGLVGLIFLCAAAATAAPAREAGAYVSEAPPSDPWLQEMLPSASAFREVSRPVRHFLGKDGEKKVGIVIFSEELAPETQGFNAHVPVAVALDMAGRIQKVRILPHHEETPAFAARVNRVQFLDQFRGKGCTDPIVLGADVDGVTGATWTCLGVTDAVRLSAARVRDGILGVPAPMAASPGWESWFQWSHLAVLALAVSAIAAQLCGLRWLRYVVLAAAFLILGVWLKTFFSVKQVLDIATLEIPSVSRHASWYILGAVALVSPLFLGRIYCAHLCPFGALTEALGRLFRSPITISPTRDRKLRRIKYGVLIALAVLYAVARRPGVLHVEPFADVFMLPFLGQEREVITRMAWLAFLAVASVLVFRFFCRYLCPAGAAMAFLARHRLFGRRRPDGHIECGECGLSCPERGGKP